MKGFYIWTSVIVSVIILIVGIANLASYISSQSNARYRQYQYNCTRVEQALQRMNETDPQDVLIVTEYYGAPCNR